jgi:hypothetical protein
MRLALDEAPVAADRGDPGFGAAVPLPGSQCGAGNGRTIAWTAHDDECCLAIGY